MLVEDQKHSHDEVSSALKLIFSGIERLKGCGPGHLKFTIDGRLVGDIGEMVAAREFDIDLYTPSRPHHDGFVPSLGKEVQIKATFQKSLSFVRMPELYLGLKLYSDGRHEVIFNGPGDVLFEAFKTRKHIGEKLLSFPIETMRRANETILDRDRIPLRNA